MSWNCGLWMRRLDWWIHRNDMQIDLLAINYWKGQGERETGNRIQVGVVWTTGRSAVLMALCFKRLDMVFHPSPSTCPVRDENRLDHMFKLRLYMAVIASTSLAKEEKTNNFFDQKPRKLICSVNLCLVCNPSFFKNSLSYITIPYLHR